MSDTEKKYGALRPAGCALRTRLCWVLLTCPRELCFCRCCRCLWEIHTLLDAEHVAANYCSDTTAPPCLRHIRGWALPLLSGRLVPAGGAVRAMLPARLLAGRVL